LLKSSSIDRRSCYQTQHDSEYPDAGRENQ
jgi:hypothetical protein